MLEAMVLAAAAPADGQSNPLMGFIPFLLVLVIFYLLILRPQQKRQREHKTMIESLQKGDRVLTTGGLYATVLNVKDSVLVASIADGVKVELSRTSVAAKVEKKS
jgi:preprotein translocase subunit YajC